jgi:hypothetical protein
VGTQFLIFLFYICRCRICTVTHADRPVFRYGIVRVEPGSPSDEGAARVGARRVGTNSSVLIVGRLLFVWDLESHH